MSEDLSSDDGRSLRELVADLQREIAQIKEDQDRHVLLLQQLQNTMTQRMQFLERRVLGAGSL